MKKLEMCEPESPQASLVAVQTLSCSTAEACRNAEKDAIVVLGLRRCQMGLNLRLKTLLGSHARVPYSLQKQRVENPLKKKQPSETQGPQAAGPSCGP